MNAPLVWLVGGGGLLGSAVRRELGRAAWIPDFRFAWQSDTELAAGFQQAARDFAQRLATEPGRRWVVAWCAGAGVVGTSAAQLERETSAFRLFLKLLGSEPQLRSAQGHFVLASSAGGVYGGTSACPITEATAPEPISPYGRTKLLQEQILASWAASQPEPVATLIARFSNLYGTAQRVDKPQGLISHISRCLIHNAAVHIYVSLDTIRDYLFSDDAGRRLARDLGRLARAPLEQRHVLKVYGSEREISIAGLLSVFRQIARRRLRVVSGLSPVGILQPRRLQFRSRVWVGESESQVELIEGVSRVYSHQLACFRQGKLPPPR